jgi:phosphate transport system substrate-binding protein
MNKYCTLIFILLSQIFSPAYANVSDKETRWQASLDQILIKPKPFESIAGNASVVTLFTIHGSNTIGGSLAPTMAVAYLKAKGLLNVRVQPLMKQNESVIKGDLVSQGKTIQIKVAAHGSSTGYKGLINGDAEIWASSRPVKDKEVKLEGSALDLRSSNSEYILGIDGLAIVVNQNNPLGSLSKAQLGQIFSGGVSNWSEIGGPDQMINLYARDENSGTWDSFKNMVLGKTHKLNPKAIRFESSEELVNNVVQDRGGIGFIGMAFVGKSKLLAVSDGPTQAFKPSEMTVATEDYALSRRLFLYTKPEHNNEFVSEFMGFSQGIRGQEIVKSEGFISQNVVSMDMALSKDLPEDYLSIVSGAKRLSINFRFNEGSAKLDNKARKDIQRVAYFLRSSQKVDSIGAQGNDKLAAKVMLIGFGDKRKNAQRSKLLSKLRAMAVRRELTRLGIYPDLVNGYGDFNPVAGFNGNSSLKNRRVEVWVR